MLLEELKSVILQLDNSNRFHTINGKRDTWLYDSYAHKIYRIDTKIINGIKRDNTNANTTSRNLEIAASDPSNTIKELTPETAQYLANQGFTVIAAREKPYGIGHIATVRPGYEYDEIYGTTLNNIGAYERTGIEKSTGSFLGDEEVHYYYDCEQFF